MKKVLSKTSTNQIARKRCRATTLPELLIVMILSGIIFLLVFDGFEIITKYNRILNNRLIMKEQLYYSHSALEFILEDVDSARLSEEKLILLYKAGEVKRTILLDSCRLCISYDNMQDTIFTNNLGMKLHFQDSSETNIDSLFIKISANNDTLLLKYNINNSTKFLYTNSNYGTNY